MGIVLSHEKKNVIIKQGLAYGGSTIIAASIIG
jgi:cephalosporin hydroxylase